MSWSWSVKACVLCALLACATWAVAHEEEGPPAWKTSKAAASEAKWAQNDQQIVSQPSEQDTAGRPIPAGVPRAADAASATPAATDTVRQAHIERAPDGATFRAMRPADAGLPPTTLLGGTRTDAEPVPCPDDSLFAQRCSTYDVDGSVGGSYSDLDTSYVRYDGFWDVRGDISGVSWYGVFMDAEYGIFGCTPDPAIFAIGFYEDNGGTPGAEVATYTVSLSGEATEMDVGIGAYATKFTAEIDPPVVLRNGWITIASADGDEDCTYSWINSPVGDGYSCYENDGEMACTDPNDFWSFDYNMCILGTFYPGACCDDVLYDCQDDVAYEDCQPPYRFEADTLCVDMEPQCGYITGACCTGETCEVLTPSGCDAIGGVYQGDYVSCDPNPCVGACCLGENVCEVHTEADCVALGGDYVGDGTDCDPNPCPPLNDDCANAEAVIEGDWGFDLTYATLDGPQMCGLGQNIWFCYTASATGTVTVTVEQDSGVYWAPSGAAYDGCVCDPFPELITCDPYGEGQFSFDVQQGSQYLIEVGNGYGEMEGTPGTLHVNLIAWAYGACCTDEAPYCTETYEQECDGTFAGDGTTCDADCNENGIPDACDIATGNSEDCNGNGIPDECDLADGTSYDYDLNGVPDECDPDCNENGIPDVCDVDCNTGNCSELTGCGESEDCQPDGIPDECQLGGAGGDETVLWDNGASDPNDWYHYALVSQIGGDCDGAFIVDDFELAEDSTINTFHASFMDESWFDWSGRVRIEVFPDDGESGPDDSGGAVVELWVPDDGGSVTRTYVGEDPYGPAYRYDVNDLNIELPAGIWWIGMASETEGDSGLSAWLSSRSEENVVMGEAHLRWPEYGYTSFVPAYYFWFASWDVSFSIGVTVSGADCNENLIPDDCDIMYCEGQPWCQDCNENGVPDGCEPDCDGNEIADECDIRDCDGSPWCLDCNENGVPDGCEPDCNGNGIADECDIRDCDGSPWCSDCNENGIPDDCDIADGTSDDYDLNGVPDECDPDCNENGIIDACDVDCGTGNCSEITGCGGSLDCQPDGVPDECQIYGEFEYLTDDGTSEEAVGLSAGGYLAWLTQFTVEADYQSIDAISLAWQDIEDGTPTTVYVWSDPDGDGDPTDAQVLTSAETVVANAGTDTFVVVDIPDTYVGPAGTSFFVGAIIEHDGGYHPSPLDMDESQYQSWIAGDGDDPIDPNDLGAPAIPVTRIDNYYSGNWLLRAIGFFNNDCNGNGIPDDCDIASGYSDDCDSNGVPDDCEWEDCNSNGVLDACDILDCPPDEIWCADCNANGIPDECDVPPLGDGQDCQPNGIPDECEEDCNGNAIPDDCDMRDCDGSPWCDDCNEDGILDECQIGVPGGVIYQYDDGSSENSIGIGYDVEIAWIQRFVAEPGSETIVAIATCFGNSENVGYSGVYADQPFYVFVWDDPDDDGTPNDAVLLDSAIAYVSDGSIDTDVLQEVSIGPVTVSGSFFVGAMVESTMYPVPMDEDGELAHESWVAYELVDDGGFDPNAFSADSTDDVGYPCNLLLRAASLVSDAENDCNGNSIPDDCDIADGTSADVNGNGIPDECECLGDLDGDDDVDLDDLAQLLAHYGVTSGATYEDGDIDGDGDVDLTDLALLLAHYGRAC